MCGIVGAVTQQPVNQLLYDGLLGLQHRGQDAAGIVTLSGPVFHSHKAPGMVRDVFRTRDMRELSGTAGIGHCRYPTAGSASLATEAQPFYANSPYGIMLGHNGNLTNSAELKREVFEVDARHINTRSDSEVLLNVLALEIEKALGRKRQLSPAVLFEAVAGVHKRCQGAYAVVALIAGFGLLAFRDTHGIRPLVFGQREEGGQTETVVASESVILDMLGFKPVRDLAPGEAIAVSLTGEVTTQRYSGPTSLTPCLFEFVYLARPDSVIDGASVYDARVRMGRHLADSVRAHPLANDIDVVIPIPDSARHAALELAMQLGKPYREGFVKNRYVGRTFIMPGHSVRKKSVRQKLNPVQSEFAGKCVLLVDDSIVRGTTSREIVQMAREAGARKVLFASAAPPVRYPNVYGIDMPTASELIAHGRSVDEICASLGADGLIFQELDALKSAVREAAPGLQEFEASCFDGRYVTGTVTEAYLDELAKERHAAREEKASEVELNED